MSRPTLAEVSLALPLCDTLMLMCPACEPEMHPCPGRFAAPGLWVTHWTAHGADRYSVTHFITGRKIVMACCLRGAWEAARLLAHPREFRWTSKRATLAKRKDAVRRFVLEAAGVPMFDIYECSRCSSVEVPA